MNSVEHMAAAATLARARLDRLTPEQRARLAALAAGRQASVTGSLHGRFAQQAAARPHAIALSCGDVQLSYGALDERATALARRLAAEGLAPGALVAITLTRGVNLIVAILAVLKAGLAYLPIDPATPAERQRFMLEDAAAPIVLSETGCCAPGPGVWLLDAPDAFAAPAAMALPEVDSAALAYVIYTSGSTGQPKGVMIEHRQVLRLFSGADQLFDFSASDVWSLFHSYAFDFSVWEIWGALLYGARLVIVPQATARSPADCAALLLREGVTVLNQTPSAFANLMPLLTDGAGCGALRYVVFGGEALEPRRLARWFARYGEQGPRMVNMYGITETTVHVTYKLLGPAHAASGLSDIGQPLPDLTLYLFNERLKSVPAGVVGELYVAGPGLARGYLNRPELTAERFIEHPAVPGERLYKTGDLARRLDGGVLEYMGRNDSQVKLRGFRIELGDIERQLQSHAAIAASVVLLHGQDEARCLAAYVVLDAALAPGSDWKGAVQRHLAAALPDYMVPAYVIALAALPLTANGKLDREQLPLPSGNDAWTRSYVAPRSSAEQILCTLYGDLLQVDRVGIDDNFFALGGDSLKTVNLVARASAAGLHFGVADIFAHPCVTDLARLAGRGQAGAAQRSGAFELVCEADRALLPAGLDAAYPMSRLQQGMVFHNLASSDNSLFHNVINQRYRGAFDAPRMRRAIGELMAVHDILRTGFQMTGYSEPLQLVHRTLEAPLFQTDLRQLDGPAQERYLEQELARLRGARLDLAAAPLFQAHLYQLADDVVELVWLEHHAILDGWSLSSFMTQLAGRYSALAQAQPGVLAAPGAAYRDFIAAERSAIADPGQAAFWQAYLQDAPYTELQGAARAGASAARQIDALAIAPDCFAACRALATGLGVPLKSVFLAAYAKTVAKFAGEPALTVGMSTHGRPETADSDAMLGLYVSTHPLRIDAGNASWRTLIQRCFEAEAGIWGRRFYPLSEISRLQGKRALFETTFTYNHFSVTEGAADIGLQAMRERRSFEFDDAGLGVTFVVGDLQGAVGHIHVAFDAVKFDAGYALRIQECLSLALQQMTADVDQPADVLGRRDAAVVAQLAASCPSVQAGDSLLAAFEALAARQPQACALEQDGRSLSYAELDARAAVAGARLLQLGIGHGTLVGFDTAPSIAMITALLALFKIGAVFVPLDPEQSRARLAALVEESGLCHIVADAPRWAGQLPGAVAVHLLAELDAAPAVPHCGTAAPHCATAARPCAADLAYTIYTSGSTGRPKGVTITHGNAVSFLRAIQRRYQLQPGERLLQVTNIGFDVFIEEILFSLFSGGTLVLRASPRLPDAAEFWGLVQSERINLTSMATAYWNLLCAALPPKGSGAPTTLRLCTVGGEAMQRVHIDRWLGHWGDSVALVNSYGPTEATATAVTFDARELARQPQRYGSVPIGFPLDNCPCWILGKDGLPAPVGVAGELFIGGEAVSPGYLNRPEETGQRFLDAGAVAGVACRLYRTGDMVRALDDGQIEFIGRLDGQVKIRGFRVEVDEICQVIGAERAVRQCIVVPVREGGENRLAAYVVLDPDCTAQAERALVARVRASLPSYMRPAAWIRMDALPMTPNRKIDTKALPLPRFDVEDEYVAPQGELEEQVQAAWAAVLERDAIGVESDFFALGGHSLLLTRLLLRISQGFGVELSMAELMRARTVREMAGLIGAARALAPAALADSADMEEMAW